MEIIVNQDIRKFKTKDIGNFSFKECLFLVAAAALGYGGYAIQIYLGLDTIDRLPIILLASIPLLFGFFKPQGMTFMEFLKTVGKESFIDPKIYVWESDFVPDLSEFGDLYGEEYALTEERIKQIEEVEALASNPPKLTKEQIKKEKEMMIL